MPDQPSTNTGRKWNGHVVTFYSYKGGTGRTMALANVAWILAANGHRVLVADWDLESPGLHRFFHPFLAESVVREAPGIIDLIRRYEWAAAKAPSDDRVDQLIAEHARVQRYALSLSWSFPDDGGLDFLSPGRQNHDYAATLGALDWDNFYEHRKGGEFLDAVRADMKRHYDYVLIDSRTGLSDVADICTVHLPDTLVDCFTLSTQGIEGAAEVAKMIEDRHKDRGIRILPVPMRVDEAEKEKVDVGRVTAVRLFAGLPAAMSETDRRTYWGAVEVPYRAFYAYEETLAVFGDAPGSPTSMLSAFERLTAVITGGAVTSLPPIDDQLQKTTKLAFARKPPQDREVIIEFRAEDQVWAEWIAGVLAGAGAVSRERRLGGPGPLPAEDEPAPSSPVLTIVSATYVAQHETQSALRSRASLPVYVTATRPLLEFSHQAAAFLAGVSEEEATARLLKLLGLVGPSPAADTWYLGARYPGSEPKIDRVPARNARFTGRENDLQELRGQLRSHGTSVVLPVTLQGLGGVGKTQIALEYAHRFRTDYDLVWWLDCGQPAFIDASLADLAVQMQSTFGISLPANANVDELARLVLDLLGQADPEPRWLLIYDNAEDIEEIEPYLPPGNGHVLITSRNRAWFERSRASLLVEVFDRAESVAHLRQRVPSMTEREADQVADILGDLPLAVATAGAWLAETGYGVPDYLHELESQASRTLSVAPLADYPQPVSRAWDLSLDRLQERSPAAARLLELCSVMAPRIALDLIYSQAMADVLAPYDPALSERMVIGRVVQEINRLALIKLDSNANRIHVHRLVQAVVQDRMTPEQMASARHDVHRVLAAARPRRDVDDPDTWTRFRLIWPHLESSRAMTSGEEPARQLFVDRVRYLGRRHDLERGRLLGEEVEQAWEEMLKDRSGQDSEMAIPLRRQLLQLRFNLANILRDEARYGEAKALDEALLGEQRLLLGPEHPHTLMTAGSLAADLKALGQYREAVPMDEVTWPAWKDLYGEDHVRTLAAASNLADSYRLTADIGEALRLDRDTLERHRRTLGPLHPNTLLSTSNFARDLLEAGRYEEAVTLMQSARYSCIEALGADSLAALNAQTLLGIALRSTGRPAQAEPHFLEALEGFIQRYGEFSTEALACRLGYAANLLSLDRGADAGPEIDPVLAVYQERLGPTHPHTLVCLLNLASARRLTGDSAGALQATDSAVTGLRDTLGEGHPYTLAALMSRAVLVAEQGELAQAEQIEMAAVEGLVEALGPDHPDVLRCRANLLLTQQQRGAPGAAAERSAVIGQLAAVVGAEHPHIAALRGERRLVRTLDPQPF
jgi:MinD-like ATPase involved in chromosome partitioning or flagellar assembly/tetratricopeptide (TPR) repeat protein